MTELSSSSVTGGVRAWLRLEGIAALVTAVYLYAHGGHSWLLFAVLFLAPDLSFIAYAAGPRIGSLVYNVLHSYLVPLLMGIALVATGRTAALSLIWVAHIGFDRLLGYGLKYPTDFGNTHLGRIGRVRSPGIKV